MGNATSGLARLDAVQRSAERLMGPAEASKLQLLSHRRGVAALSCFHRIVYGSAPVAVLPLCPPRAPPQTRPSRSRGQIAKARIPPENTPRSPHSHALVLAEQLRAPPFSGMERPGPVDSIHRRPSNVQERGEQLKPPPLTSVSLFVIALGLCLRILQCARWRRTSRTESGASRVCPARCPPDTNTKSGSLVRRRPGPPRQ